MSNEAITRALRFAQANAVTERARGRQDEERKWLDMCALLSDAAQTPPASTAPEEI